MTFVYSSKQTTVSTLNLNKQRGRIFIYNFCLSNQDAIDLLLNGNRRQFATNPKMDANCVHFEQSMCDERFQFGQLFAVTVCSCLIAVLVGTEMGFL
jgi:hypothetical protein